MVEFLRQGYLQNRCLLSSPKPFFGRKKISEDVVNAVEQRTPVCWIWGPPGCGKSAVAINVVHNLNKSGNYSIPMFLEEPSNVKQVEEFIMLHLKRAETFQSYKVFFIDKCYTMLKKEDEEEKFVEAMERLSKSHPHAFTVIITAYEKPSLHYKLNISSLKVSWPDRTEAVELLALSCRGVDVNAVKNHYYLTQLLASCCCRMPFAIIAVGSVWVERLESTTDVPASLREQLECFRNRHSLFQDFCENFDSKRRVLQKCFEKFYLYLSADLQKALRCLSVVNGSFSKNCGERFLGKDVTQGKITSLLMLGILESEECHHYSIPDLFRQYVLTLSDHQDAHERARAAYCKYIKKVMVQMWKNRKSAKALEIFQANRRRIEGFLEDSTSIESDAGKSLALVICMTEYSIDGKVLLECTSPSIICQFCKSCLKSSRFHEEDRLHVSLFYAQVLLHRCPRRRIDAIDRQLSFCKTHLEALSADKQESFRTRYLVTLVELCLVKGTSLLDEDLDEIEKQKRLQNKAARLAAAKARFQLGAMSYGKDVDRAHGHLNEAVRHFRECRDELRETDCSRCLHQMWIGDCLFRKGNYKDALGVFNDLLKEIEEVSWPGEGVETKDRKNMRISAICYAQGLSQTLHCFAENSGWNADQLKECLKLFESSLEYIRNCSNSPFLHFIYLAKGKLHLLLFLCGEEHDSKQLELATQCFEKAAENDRIQCEASSFEKICNAPGKLSTKNIFDSAKIFLPSSGGFVNMQELFKSCKRRNEALDPYKSLGISLFANSALYLDSLKRERSKEVVSLEKEDVDFEFSDEDDDEEEEEEEEEEGVWWENDVKAQTEFPDENSSRRLLIPSNCFRSLSLFEQHQLCRRSSESRGNTNTLTNFDSSLSQWQVSSYAAGDGGGGLEKRERIDQKSIGIRSQDDESSLELISLVAEPPTMSKSPP